MRLVKWLMVVVFVVSLSTAVYAGLSKHVEVGSIEVLTNGVINVRIDTIIKTDDDKNFAKKYRRYVLVPGDDLIGQPKRVVAIANLIWTNDVIKDYERSLEGDK